MNKEYEVWEYKNLLKTKIIMMLLGLLVPCIELLTKDSFDEIEWGFVIIPPVVAISIVLLLTVFKFVLATILLSFDVDVKSAAGILKRKENKKNYTYNKMWDAHICYFDGDFSGLSFCVEEIIKHTDKKKRIFVARELHIMALFVTGEYDKLKELIELQKQIIPEIPEKIVGSAPVYYDFFLNYISGEYKKCAEIFEALLQKNNVMSQNNIKISIFYFLRMAYEEMGNEEQVERCTKEISLCDKKNLTFFTR